MIRKRSRSTVCLCRTDTACRPGRPRDNFPFLSDPLCSASLPCLTLPADDDTADAHTRSDSQTPAVGDSTAAQQPHRQRHADSLQSRQSVAHSPPCCRPASCCVRCPWRKSVCGAEGCRETGPSSSPSDTRTVTQSDILKQPLLSLTPPLVSVSCQLPQTHRSQKSRPVLDARDNTAVSLLAC